MLRNVLDLERNGKGVAGFEIQLERSFNRHKMAPRTSNLRFLGLVQKR